MKLIIQIPCFNEEKTLGVTLADLPRSIEGIDQIEWLVVNDGSTDRTAETAKKLGVHHVVSFRRNRGLARGFMAGLEASLKLGADIIVNTDADNQYRGDDIALLVAPILEGKADIVIGERPIAETSHFSPLKKQLQKLGSAVVRLASKTDVPDAPSGFRAYSREAALRMNVVNDYTYTLETIIQAGRNRMAVVSVPVRTNPELRTSRLFGSMFGYVRKSSMTIVRAFLMYRPMQFFGTIGVAILLCGVALGGRFLWYYFSGGGDGHVQSLILAAILIMLGFHAILIAFLADLIAANRKILEDIQRRVRDMDSRGERTRSVHE